MYHFSQDLTKKVEFIIKKLAQENKKISFAESCTGGLLSAIFTEISGSSKVIDRNFVTYSNQSKIDLLNISKQILEQNGAVSHECAYFMAKNLLEITKNDFSNNFSVAITGIAGPNGATKDKKNGTVFISFAYFDKNGEIQVKIQKFIFAGNRNQVRNSSITEALRIIEQNI